MDRYKCKISPQTSSVVPVRVQSETPEGRRDLDGSWFIIHPRSQFWVLWTTLQLLIVLYLFFELPHHIAFRHFQSDEDYLKSMPITLTVDRIVDIILLLEHIFNYILTYPDIDKETGVMMYVTKKK